MSRGVVLLWGIGADGPLAAVREELERCGADVAFLDQQRIAQTRVELEVGAGVTGTLHLPGRRVALEDVCSAYVRPYDVTRMASVAAAGSGSAAWTGALGCERALACWTDLTEAAVVNRMAAMASNGSKPYQARFLRAEGFEVPDTLLTTDPAAVAAFREKHAAVIYKSMSGVRSIVARLGPDHAGRVDDVAHCPTQFQEYVPGLDVRVHVVGDDVAACAIDSGADDYRFAPRSGVAVAGRPLDLPPDVSDRCVALTRKLDLLVAGIDLRRRPDGRWFCFEVNPSPAFTYYEHLAGRPIAPAIASLLVGSRRRAS